MRWAIEFIDMDREELNQLVERARASLSAEEYRKLKGVVEALTYLTDLVADQETTIHDLRELLFPAATEKTEAVLKKAGIEGTSKAAVDKQGTSKAGERNQNAPGHGRNGAEAYRNPRRVRVSHESLKHGDKCPRLPEGQSLRAAGAEAARAHRGTSSPDGDRLRAAALALQSMRRSV